MIVRAIALSLLLLGTTERKVPGFRDFLFVWSQHGCVGWGWGGVQEGVDDEPDERMREETCITVVREGARTMPRGLGYGQFMVSCDQVWCVLMHRREFGNKRSCAMISKWAKAMELFTPQEEGKNNSIRHLSKAHASRQINGLSLEPNHNRKYSGGCAALRELHASLFSPNLVKILLLKPLVANNLP